LDEFHEIFGPGRKITILRRNAVKTAQDASDLQTPMGIAPPHAQPDGGQNSDLSRPIILQKNPRVPARFPKGFTL
jgi:hypothetical protein